MDRPKDHPQRYGLTDELHARPFPEITTPCLAVCFVVTLEDGTEAARADLLALLDAFKAAHPPEGASHHYGPLGQDMLKWERHSEFVSYTLFVAQDKAAGFSPEPAAVFPAEWLVGIGGEIITAAQVQISREGSTQDVEERLRDGLQGQFVGESLAAAYVLERNAALVGDFRIDASGHMRFAVIGIGDVGARRMGRVVQRLLEVEIYRSVAMLTLPVARKVFAGAAELDRQLAEVTRRMTLEDATPERTLEQLLAISAKIERLAASASFRFSAGRAYGTIVTQRIRVLREDRLLERQLFSEFMMRRFDPAMRTCEAAEKRLADLSEHAARAADLLGTRVSVAAAEQNRKLLDSMNRRAAMQMRLQETVEGLSVVAVSYYAVNLLVYLLTPLSKPVGLDKTLLAAGLVLPVIAVVWLMVRKIRARIGGG